MMPEKRELKRLEELAKKKKRLLLLQQRLLTDATLPSMEPTTSRRKLEISKDDSSPSQRSARSSKSGTKSTPTASIRKRPTLSSSSTSALGDEEREPNPNISEKSSSLASSRDSSPRGAKRSSKASEAHEAIMENLAKKLKSATPTVSRTGSAKKSASKSRDNSPHQIKLKSKSRDCSPRQIPKDSSSSTEQAKSKDGSIGMKPKSRDPSPRIAKLKNSETASDNKDENVKNRIETEAKNEKPNENVAKQSRQKLSAVESLSDKDTLLLLKPTIPEKVSSSNPLEIGTQTDQEVVKRRRRKGKLKRLVQTAKTQVKNSEPEQSFHRGRPKGSKNKKWSGNAGVKTKLRGTSGPTPAQQPTRKRTLSGEFELIDERQLKREIKSKEMGEEKEETEALLDTSNDNIFIEETCEQLDFSDTEYDDEEHMEELVLEPSPSKADTKPAPRKLSEVMEPSLAKSDAKLSEKVSTEVLESSPLNSDDQPTPKKTPEIVKLLSVKKKATEEVESSSLKSENLETVSVKSETGEPMSENESKCGLELNPKESTSGVTEATENVSCETQCDFVDEKDESGDKPDSKPKEEVSLKETPEKIEASSSETKLEISSKKRGRRPTSIIKTVTEIMVKPSGETTKLRTITTKSEKDDSVTELSSVDTKNETVSRNLFSNQDDDVESVQSVSSFSDASSLSSNSKGTKSRDLSLVKKKKKREVFTYRHKRFTRKKKRKVDLMLNKSIDSSLDDNQDNGDIPVLSPTETQFPDVPNTDLPSPLLNMPVLMKEQLPKPIKRRGRPRILPIKIPSGRGRGRPRKPEDDVTNEMIMSSELLGVEMDADPVIHTSISPTISYSTVELDFGLDKEQKTDDGTVIADIVNGLVNDVCRDLTILKAKQDSTKLETGKIPLKIPLGPRLKGKKGNKRKGHHMQSKHAGPKHNKSRSLHSINCTPIESLSWKLDNSGSPEGSTKLVFKRRKQTNTLKSMSERENSLFLAEVEQLIREKEKSTTDVPSRARQFMLREKVSRSPLEILAMKDKLEEEEYEKSQIPKRKPRSKQKYESDNFEEPLPSTSQEPEEAPAPVPPVSVKYNGPVHEMKSLCKPCHVPVINIVSYVNKHMEGDGHELDENAFSDGIDKSDSDKSYVLTEEEQSEYDNEEEMFRKKFVVKKMEKSVPMKEVEPESKNSIKIDELKEDGYIASYVEFLKSQSEPSKPKTPKIAKVTPIMKATTEKPQESNSSTTTVASSGNSTSLSSSSKPDVSNSSSSVSSSTAVVLPSTHQSPPTVSSTSETTEGSPVQQYSCKSCDFSSPVKNQIENHIYTHISHVVFRCASCNSQDRTLAAAQRHQNAAHPHSNQTIIKIPRVREEDYYNTTKSNHPFYVSLVVQGNFSLNTSSIRNPSNRFVCTHCQYSTNIKEDIDQHILDLHKDRELFVCTLCDRAMYHSTAEIQAHCQQTHPSRPDCFRKLPHFYDCELTDSSERGRTDGRGNIFDRMTNFLNPVQSSNDHQNAESDRIRCAKEYLNIQDSINKRANESGNSSPSEVIVQAPVVEEVSEETTAKDTVDDTPRITEITDLTSTSVAVTHSPREHSIARSILQGNTVIADNAPAIKSSNSNTTTSQILSIPASRGSDESSLSTAGTTKMMDEDKRPDVEKISMEKEGDNVNNSINVDDDVSEPKPNEPMEDSDGLGGLKIISVVSLQGQNFTDDASSSKKETVPVNLPFTQSPLVIPRPHQIHVPQKQKLLLPKPSQTLLTAVEKKPPKPKDILPKAPVSVDDIVLRNERLTCTYKCKICNVHAPFLSVIVEHLMQHHQSICVFTCPYCKLSEGKKPDFKTELKARDHIAKHHPSHYAKKDTSLSDSAKEIVQVVAIPSSADFQRGKTSNIERDIYMCQKCSTHLPSLNYMYSHIENEHDDVFLHVCPECKKYKHKSEDVVYKHVMDVHLKDPSKVDLSLAMEDNLFTRIYSISKNAVYSEKSHSSEESNPSNIKHGLASESSQQSSSLSTTVQNVVKKRPTARKSMKRVDDITEARALVIAANQNRKTPSPSVTQHRPIIGSQLFTDCSTVTTTSVTSSTTKSVTALVPVMVSQPPTSLPRKQLTPVSTSIMQTTPVIQKSNYLHLSSDEASQLAKQKHLPVGYKTVAQQLKERKLKQLQSAILKQQAADDAGVSSSPSLTQSEHYLTSYQQNESVQSKKFSMTDRLHRLNKPSTSTTGTPILNVPKPVLKVPSMDKIRNLARPKSLPSASESVDITMAQEMSNYPGILRPPAASSSSPRSLSGFSMNTAPKGPSPKPQPSLLFPRGLSPKLPVKSPVPIDADTDDPEAFKIFNLKPSKPSASQGKPPQISTPPVPNLKGPFPQLVNLPTGIQFPQIPINIGGQAGQIPSIFTQGFPGVVLLQPQALNNAVMSPVNAFGAEPQGFAGINTFKCPYCSTVLERKAVRPHIEGMHKGCAVIYKPLGM